MNQFNSIADDVKLGEGVRLLKFVNLYGCSIGDGSKIGAFVEIQKNAAVGKNCKISSHAFICEGVAVGDNCFVGHGVVFINDNEPRSVKEDGSMERDEDWRNRFVETRIEDFAVIGSNATILGGITIGTGAVIGAGSVVTKDVPAGEIWVGNPARFLRKVKE
ncbi:MAG: N-acetyltransferase [Candidatus Omnitrophica bacterium]|nr:N-acetyltransferase [Candidatus Omnitrophota bacterium]